ncbi:MAG: hypothetical protein AB1758_07070 [Candidatus Eremiobacterota bacterium]
MVRLAYLFVFITLCELVAFAAYRNHPLAQPGWFGPLLDAIKVAMCWGGVEGARWLLRKSPIARKGAGNDWSRLWLWVGPPSGLLLALACVLGWCVAQVQVGRLAGPLVVAHAAAGALSWLIAAPWVVGDLFRQTTSACVERRVLYLGIFFHLCGLTLYAWLYPARTMPPLALVGSLMFYYFILYHLMVSVLLLGGLFRLWKPELADPPEPVEEPEEESVEEDPTGEG